MGLTATLRRYVSLASILSPDYLMFVPLFKFGKSVIESRLWCCGGGVTHEGLVREKCDSTGTCHGEQENHRIG
jgi:hypothetical protein